jgi:prepilin-type N-terminal cleavage/methylation domain-containing protein
MRHRVNVGFTLVELMVVVVIVGVLAAVANNVFHRYMNNARKTEVLAMFGEIRAKEEAYRAEFSRYAGTAVNENVVYPSPNGTPQLWDPDGNNNPGFTQPANNNWDRLGINPGKNQLHCGFSILAGPAGGLTGPRCQSFLGGNFPATGQWWCATAICDLNPGVPTNATFVTSSDRQTILERNVQD